MDAATAHAFFAAADPLRAYCRDPLLWADLAANETLLAAVRGAHERVQAFVRAD
jgi:D-arabinitol 4-dehydrogenase